MASDPLTTTRSQCWVREDLLTRPWVGGSRPSRRKARGQCDIWPGSTHASFYRRRIIPIREVSWRAHLWVPNTAIERHIFNIPTYDLWSSFTFHFQSPPLHKNVVLILLKPFPIVRVKCTASFSLLHEEHDTHTFPSIGSRVRHHVGSPDSALSISITYAASSYSTNSTSHHSATTFRSARRDSLMGPTGSGKTTVCITLHGHL